MITLKLSGVILIFTIGPYATLMFKLVIVSVTKTGFKTTVNVAVKG